MKAGPEMAEQPLLGSDTNFMQSTDHRRTLNSNGNGPKPSWMDYFRKFGAKKEKKDFVVVMGRKLAKRDNKGNVALDYNQASFHEMMRYASKFDWFLFWTGAILSVIAGALAPVGSVIFRGITNTLLIAQNEYDHGGINLEQFSSDVLFYVLMYLLLGVVTFVFSYSATACFFTLCERQLDIFRKKFLYAVLHQDIEWFDSNEIGKLTQKMSSGIDRIRDGTSDKIVMIIQAFACLISGLVVGFCMSWQMTLVMLVVIPFIILVIWGSAWTVRSSLRKQNEAYGTAGAVAEEVINGIRTVAAFNAQFFEIERYSKYLHLGCRNGTVKHLLTGVFSGMYLLILFASMGVAFWFGTMIVLDGGMTPGTVFAVFWACVIGAMRVGQAVPQISTIMGAKVSAGEVFSIIDRKPKLDCSTEKGIKLAKVEGRISFDDIYFHYPSRPDVPILNGVSFEVEPGHTVALVGHSGCGKSTMISFLMRYYSPEKGSVLIDGKPIEDLNVNWLRNVIGIVSQEPIVFAATITENMKMGKEDLTEEEMIKACEAANAHEFICRLPNGYDTQIGEGGVKLSGGQKQRLAIARALVRNPKILLLDEATSALDTESERIVQKAIDQAASGRTTIMIAHRLSTVRNADKIIVFDHGKIVEQGTHEELMELGGIYKGLVQAQEIEQYREVDDVVVEDEGSPSKALSRSSSRGSRSEFSDSQRVRASNRLKQSMASAAQNDPDTEDQIEEMEEEDAEKASFKDIWEFAKPERVRFVLGLICTFLRGAIFPAFSLIYGQMFTALEQALSENKHEEVTSKNVVNALAFGGLGLFGCIFTLTSGYLLGQVGERMTMRLRIEVFKNILRQDGAYFDDLRHSTGKLTARLASDAPNVQAAIDQRLAEVLQGLVSLICGVAIAFYFSFTMAPIGLGSAAVIVIIQLFLTNVLKKRALKDVMVAEEASRIASESIEHVKTVQALTRQNYLYESFCRASVQPHKRAIFRGLLQSLTYGLTGAFVSFNFASAYFFGLLLIQGGYTTPFIVFQVIEALNMASITVIAAASFFPEYIRAKVAAGLMFKMMRHETKIDSLSDAGMTPVIEGNVECENVFFCYPNTPHYLILNEFSVTAHKGETLAFVGPSGCGKSTTIQLLERYYDVMAGSIKIDGVDIRQISIRHLRNHLAIVSQEPTLFNLSIAQNIAYGLDNIDMNAVISAAKTANVHDFIDSLPHKYDTPVGARGGQLSGGQKQRISIARAMIRNPKILLLDEATSALDSESEKIVQAALDKASRGRTAITIAHRLSTIQHADQIAVVKNGHVVENGKHQQLLARKGLYHRLVQKQSG
ncbi:unnamed protein product [Bursaphelenchus xylophilus]|nr:unnamed protein product [Bursaphelenchus xylophilus]CAG9100026.1 unnamed protein product [Bursaphelenchus xylophilus]